MVVVRYINDRLWSVLVYLVQNSHSLINDDHGGGEKTKKGSVQPIPTYLNQLGRQSSWKRNFSPSVKRPVLQPLHLGELGQLK